MSSEWLNAQELAAALGIKKRDTAAALIRSGTIPGEKVGREYRVRRSDVEAFIAATGGRWRRNPVGRTSRYQPLAHFLTELETDVVRMTFREIETLVGPLPPAARGRPSWWANGDPKAHSQARAWTGIGWRMSKVRLDEETVIFDRLTDTSSVPRPSWVDLLASPPGVGDIAVEFRAADDEPTLAALEE